MSRQLRDIEDYLTVEVEILSVIGCKFLVNYARVGSPIRIKSMRIYANFAKNVTFFVNKYINGMHGLQSDELITDSV